MISTFAAIIDSNVFYGARLRSLIMYLAQTGIFRARWTDDIHREWIQNLITKRPDLEVAKLSRVQNLMNESVLDCLVVGYEPLIPSLNLPDPGDRHILAAAIKGHASCIVTFNLNDFPSYILDQYGIHARHPDEFLLDLFGLDEERCMNAVQNDIEHYTRPPLSLDTYLDSLEKAAVPGTASFLRDRKIIFE
jgi:predicted nucleic acid-binding protein